MNLTVTIMAGGNGKRMCSNIPKVLHTFKEIPILVRIINESLKLNPNKIIIITGEHDLLIQNTINNYIGFNNEFNNLFDTNIIQYVRQENQYGTGDAIKCTLNYYSDDEKVLILNGDMPLISYQTLLEFVGHKNKMKDAKLLVAKLDNPYGYGRILYNNNNEFIGIREEKDCTIEEKNIKIINVGIYMFHSKILKEFIPLIDNNNNQKEYYLTDIVKIIKNKSEINIETFVIDDNKRHEILGVNTKEELLNLESGNYMQ